MEEPKSLTPRQWWLYRLIKWATLEQDTKLSISQIIDYQNKYGQAGKLTFTDIYNFSESEGNHSNCPEIYKDVDIINESDELDKIICKKNNQFWLGNESECIQFHNKLMHNVCRDSHKAKIIRDKISQDGQGKLITFDGIPINDTNAREFHESFIRQENLLKELDKKDKTIHDLEIKVLQYKNQAEMYKERYEYYKNNGGH